MAAIIPIGNIKIRFRTIDTKKMKIEIQSNFYNPTYRAKYIQGLIQ